MYYVFGAFVVSCILYWILQSKEDDKSRIAGTPMATTGKRVALFVVLFLVSVCLFFFLQNAFKNDNPDVTDDVESGGSYKVEPNYKQTMLKNIHEDVHVGLPPFSASDV
jgi:hypothetical protein